MKNLSYLKSLMVVLVLSCAMLIPMTVSASVNELYPEGKVFTPGQYTLDLDLCGNTTELDFEVVNGESGKEMVSSVKITVMNDKKKVVIISPDQFSQRKFSNALGTLGEDFLNDLEELSLEIRVSGPKDGKITLFVNELCESAPTMPPRPSGW